MQHTYLRYECADAFALTTSTSTSTAPPTTSPLTFLTVPSSSAAASASGGGGGGGGSICLSTASSQIVGFDLRTTLTPRIKIAHRDEPTGGVGTGRALNGDECTCLDVGYTASESGSESASVVKVASGWVDGTIRIFDVTSLEIMSATSTSASSSSSSQHLGLVNSLLNQTGGTDEDLTTREPLVLRGHGSTPIRTVVFEKIGAAATRLASGGSDGTVIIWDIVAETGLYRLLGHSGPVTDLNFVNPGLGSALDGLISSSSDGLVKIWDLDGQCSVQTIASHRGEVTCSVAVCLGGGGNAAAAHEQNGVREGDGGNNGEDGGKGRRWRLLTGCADGAVRVWSVGSSGRRRSRPNDDVHGAGSAAVSTGDGGGEALSNNEDGDDNSNNANHDSNDSIDDVCHYVGTLPPPGPSANVVTSNERITSLHFHPSQNKFAGMTRANSKTVTLYRVRSELEASRRRVRRLRRRREKAGKGKGGQAAGGGELEKKGGRKRGILDDDSDYDDDNDEEDDQKQLGGGSGATTMAKVDSNSLLASDEFEYVITIRASHKIKGFTFAPSPSNTSGGGAVVLKVVCALATNALEVHTVKRQKQKGDDQVSPPAYATNKLSTLDMYGHPTGIRSISLTSDDVLACTVSKNMAKVWNVGNRSCLRSLTLSSSSSSSSSNKKQQPSSSYYGLCSAFLPGNTHVVIGTREGHLLVLDVASGDIVYTEEKAHDGAIWSLDLRRPNPEHDEAIAVVTGSADKVVKFWDVERQEEDDDDEEEGGGGHHHHHHHPMVVHTRSLQMNDDVVAVRYSHTADPTRRMVFVSTLDCTIKVFFDDTLKFFLSLYGHKLPALAVDASDDDAILATGGADKTVKIWGLDFGDTHRTMHGHGDSVTDLQFVRRTHNFFTTCKDGTVRYWDGDRFEQILVLPGHAAEVSCLAASRTGAFVLTGGMDRQVRVWERTRDIVFLEEERERELESMFDRVDGSGGDDRGTASLLRRRRRGDGDEDEDDDDDAVVGDDHPQSEAAVKRSVLSVSSGDRIMEGIERADQETKDIAAFSKGQKGSKGGEKRRMPNPMLLGMEPPQYILWVLRSVKSAELEQSLLVLPLSHMQRLLHYLIVLLRSGRGVELCSKVAIFLVKTHQTQIVANHSLAAPLRELKRLVKLRLAEIRDTVGFNQAALRAIARAANDRKNAYLVPDAKETDIWADLGLGSDVAAALESKSSNKVR